MTEEYEQPTLEEYPLNVTPGRFELLDAETIYRFQNRELTDGRWLAVCKVRSTFKDRRTDETISQEKVRIYRWQFKEKRRWNPDERKSLGTGEYAWTQEELCTPSKKYWESIKSLVDEFLSEI